MPEKTHLRVLRAEDAQFTRFGEVEARWIIDRSTVGSEQILMGLATYPPGARVDEHYHPNAEEVVFVLAGRGAHLIDGERFALESGSFVFIPRGAIHAMEAGVNDHLEILWAYGGAATLEEAGFVSMSPKNDGSPT